MGTNVLPPRRHILKEWSPLTQIIISLLYNIQDPKLLQMNSLTIVHASTVKLDFMTFS